MTILLFSRNNCADFICISFLIHVTELSLKFLPSVSKDFLLLFHNLPNIMVYNKSRPYLILLLLIPFLPCKLYSYDCIYYIYQWHSPLNVKYMWALATLTMHVCNILAFNISAVFSVPSNCVLNSSVFHVQKHGLFQNPLFLSQETNLNCVFFSLNVTFSTSLCYFKSWYILVVF